MTCTDNQVRKLKQMSNQYTQEIAALKSSMSTKTARKYLASNKLPSEMKQVRHWKTRSNIFTPIWPEIADMLDKSPKLQAVTILEYLQNQEPGKYDDGKIRTLQRLMRNWHATSGSDNAVIFSQELKPGMQSQSDYTVMDKLGVTIAGERFDHLLFHFMLPYSKWEYAGLCYSESLESLTQGYDEAVWSLGCVAPEHRTDNLTAATQAYGNSRKFTKNWQEVMDHYIVKPSRNNPGASNENGSVEKSHHLLKTAVEQQLMLRGSSDFSDKKQYMKFIDDLVEARNSKRQVKFTEEIAVLKPLPSKKYYAPLIVEVTVSRFSTVRLCKAIYSVPSRLIGFKLRAYIDPSEIKLYYGVTLVEVMPRVMGETNVSINYKHVIRSLVRKPGAFANYYYRDHLFPSNVFRTAYDMLVEQYPVNGSKQYLKILLLAAIVSESDVQLALELLIANNSVPNLAAVEELIKTSHKPHAAEVKIETPSLCAYDSLFNMAA